MLWKQEPKTWHTELLINNSCIINNKKQGEGEEISELKQKKEITGLKQKNIPRVQTKTHINPNQPSALIPRLQSLGGFFLHFFLSGPMTFTSAGGIESAAISHQLRDRRLYTVTVFSLKGPLNEKCLLLCLNERTTKGKKQTPKNKPTNKTHPSQQTPPHSSPHPKEKRGGEAVFNWV